VNYLGYPGTMGAGFMDYIIGDPITIPWTAQPFFAERIVQLPHCYQPNDSRRVIAERIPSRTECGLPETGFVFCCFNNPNKLTRDVFGIWMRLLRAVPGSVLWLLDPNAAVKGNLLAEAGAHGIASERLVFASRLPQAEHLARHRVADLFLDTLPYNAHTTASDALWAGLPLLTRQGETFAGRVAASLLTAVRLEDLITHSAEDYVRLAVSLASDPERLADLRSRLEEGRRSAPLFDTALYTRHLEAAYQRMWEICSAGSPPEAFAVAP
jgi:protein O-GlcNAc transferase